MPLLYHFDQAARVCGQHMPSVGSGFRGRGTGTQAVACLALSSKRRRYCPANVYRGCRYYPEVQLNGIAIRNSKSLLLESDTVTYRGTISDIAFINSCYQMRSCPIVCDIHSISISSIEFAKSMRSVVVSGSPGSISRFEHDGSKSGGRETNIVESVSGPSRGDCCRDPDCWGDG